MYTPTVSRFGVSLMALALDGESLCHPPFGRVEPRRGEGCNAVGIHKTTRTNPSPDAETSDPPKGRVAGAAPKVSAIGR